MDIYIHTLISVGSLLAFFFAGEYFGKKSTTRDLAEDMVEHTLNMLERDGLIRTETDKDGEREIVPISEIITDTLRNVKT
mgnify:FL=1|jgi:hypothetical protein|tara:strand:+ start:487 stop:726 length:240 start_codon:yes stop_codon:yes gene_type:complete